MLRKNGSVRTENTEKLPKGTTNMSHLLLSLTYEAAGINVLQGCKTRERKARRCS